MQATYGADLLKNGNAIIKHAARRGPAGRRRAGARHGAAARPGDPEGVVVGINPQTGDVTTIATQGQPAGTNGKPRISAVRSRPGHRPVPDQREHGQAVHAGGGAREREIHPQLRDLGAADQDDLGPGMRRAARRDQRRGRRGRLRSACESGLAQSVNTVYAQLAVDVGLDKVKALAAKAGVPTAFDEPKTAADPTGFHYGFDGTPGTACPVFPSQSLGIAVSPADLATGYSTLVNGGHLPPAALHHRRARRCQRAARHQGHARCSCRRSRPASGSSAPRSSQQVVQAHARQVVTDGTAQPTLGQLPFTLTDIVGKTGTTEKENNAWFVGCRPTLCLAVWMGYPTSTRTGNRTR